MEKGQGILEYTLLLAMVIGVIIYALFNNSSGLQGKMINVYNKTGTALGNVTDSLTTTVFGM